VSAAADQRASMWRRGSHSSRSAARHVTPTSAAEDGAADEKSVARHVRVSIADR
jgi:hypothetical protein